jgi:hypothetical protein
LREAWRDMGMTEEGEEGSRKSSGEVEARERKENREVRGTREGTAMREKEGMRGAGGMREVRDTRSFAWANACNLNGSLYGAMK